MKYEHTAAATPTPMSTFGIQLEPEDAAEPVSDDDGEEAISLRVRARSPVWLVN